MQDHRKLEVYQAAKQLAIQTYAVAAQLPRTERFQLANQLRRAAVSVASNIAEGCGRSTSLDFARFLDDAPGSANELEFQLEVAVEVGLVSSGDGVRAAETAKRVQQMLTRLVMRVRRAPIRRTNR